MRIRAFLLSLVAAGAVSAEEPDVEAGRDLYMAHCWQCHGRDATGNGPMADMLSITTPDLTTLVARNAGLFPLANVARQIDGRAGMLAHGGDMPIFGRFLETDGAIALRLPSGQPMMTSVPLAHLIVYLESVQTP
jgi:mono/diheme cytochrome c family protein